MKKIFIILLAVMLLTGCAAPNTPDNTQTDDQGQTQDQTEKRVLTIAQTADITTFDPQNAFNTPTDSVLTNMFSHLLERDAVNNQLPCVALSVENVDELTWRVVLRDDVTFHNGDKLTAQDVKFTFERVASDETLAVQPYYSQISEVRIVDETTCDFITKVPMPTLKIMTSFSGSWILPKKYIEDNGWEYFLKNPIGSGPYKLKEWVRDDRVVLVPYENYFDGKQTEWDEVIFRSIPESATRVGELLTGGVDIALNIPPNEWERINGNEGTHIIYGDTSYVPVLLLRLTEGWPTADLKVRQAMEMAINKTQIADVLYQGAATPTRTRMTPGCFGSQTTLYGQDNFNLEQAKKLLSESTYKGEPLTLNAGRGRFILDGELAEMVAGMLTEAGFNVNLEIADWSTFVDVYRSKSNKDILMIGLGDSLYDSSDSLLHYTIDRAKDQTDYVNEETDRLFKEAGQNLNVEEREKQYQRIQDIVAQELPHIPLVQIKAVYGVATDIEFVPPLNESIRVTDIHRSK
ncbi:MAG: ABC transporter substrate-binding protein [Clostridia bacterium]